MKKILLLSDTHGYFGKEIKKHAAEVDELWHAGDIGNENWLDLLPDGVDLRAVYGNIDNQKIRNQFPNNIQFYCEQINVYMTHIGGYPPNYTPEIKRTLEILSPDLFICGHSHILRVINDQKRNILHMNPGAIGKHGFHKVRTMLQFEISMNKIKNLNVIQYSR